MTTERIVILQVATPEEEAAMDTHQWLTGAIGGFCTVCEAFFDEPEAYRPCPGTKPTVEKIET